MEALSEAKLHLKREKCKFHKEDVRYLGLIIKREGVMMNLDKMASVQDWPVPKKLSMFDHLSGFPTFIDASFATSLQL